MKRSALCCFFSFFVLFLNFPAGAKAQGNEVILPAGTLLRCTLNEPDFSSKTADVGDPVLCHLSSEFLFNRSVFPRGAYLGGHLVAAKEPGHFVGKGYLQLEFDHIGLPDEQIALPAKIIAARGFKVDKKGDILGKGHATRDAVEWMFPPLWPIKVLTLPARGPRPTLKGEEVLTLRVMDDISIPTEARSNYRYNGYNGRPSADSFPHADAASASRYIPARPAAPAYPPVAAYAPAAPAPAEPAYSTRLAPRVSTCLLATRDGATYLVIALRVDGNRLNYTLANGTAGAVRLDEVDWTRTYQSNAENGTAFSVTERQYTR